MASLRHIIDLFIDLIGLAHNIWHFRRFLGQTLC